MDTILTIVKLLGRLGLFIYGMKLMGDGLENAAGEGLKKILEKVLDVISVSNSPDAQKIIDSIIEAFASKQ